MKRLTLLALTIVLLFSLAACQNTDPNSDPVTDPITDPITETEETTAASVISLAPTTEVYTLHSNLSAEEPTGNILPDEYKYTLSPEYISEVNVYKNSGRSKVLTGGALVYLDRKDLFGVESKSGETSGYCYSIFDEETMTLKPICSDSDCTHEDYGCFSRELAFPDGVNYCAVVNDLVINSNATAETVSFTYHSLDGTVQNKAEYKLSNLLLPDGSSSEEYLVSFVSTCRYGNKLYFDVMSYSSANTVYSLDGPAEYSGSFYHWILCFDIAAGEIYPVGGFEVSSPRSLYVTFLECTEEKISCVFEYEDYFIIDLKTKTTEKINASSVVNILKYSGRLSFDTDSSSAYMLPIEGLLSVLSPTTNKTLLFDTETLEEINPEEDEFIEFNDPDGLKTEFVCNGKSYVMIKKANGKDYRLLGSEGEISGTTEITQNREGEEGKYSLHTCFESEDGFVYYLIKRNAKDVVTKTENGVQVNYFLPLEMVYISKADILDGGEVTPLYYNPETGMFSRQ